MSWEKVGKTLAGLLVVAGAVTAVYMSFKDDRGLEASIAYQALTYPSQFNERIGQAREQLKYERLFAGVEAVAKGALNRDQVEALVTQAQTPYMQLFAKPFEAGLVDHRTGLFLTLRNTSDKPLSQVYIRLPAKGLVQVRDDAGDDSIPEKATNIIQIPSIEAGGVCRVWVYFDADFSQITQGGISVVHADGPARLQFVREVSGFQAQMARYGQWLIAGAAGLGFALLILAYICVGQRRRLRRLRETR
ncbi:hypothetical protein IAE35_13910 [Pseudomonas sp. S75]|uniref:hypothetical protein n=1 Tax=unclassified Pseudomonas TaxID=196821 RepID=UPI001905291F|nr:MULTISPECIES: hypothetical protein [unclassified Pseudomonas]MBJ9976624.1 hypothetical protein [Pseudomonas sp. S30]MBK0154440.1 hypothetical protein [Pseudomonas sp. S75]